ncbi:MAG: PilZ domain-containing protein [Gammaproteobacteria bacterium]
MEHRWNARLPARLRVRLCRSGGRNPVECYSSNVSLEGAFLNLGASDAHDLGLRAGAPLLIEFGFDGALAHQPARVERPGIVRHRRREGVGVMFCTPTPELVEAVREEAARASEALEFPAPPAPEAGAVSAQT